jgi:hypothetical protein
LRLAGPAAVPGGIQIFIWFGETKISGACCVWEAESVIVTNGMSPSVVGHGIEVAATLSEARFVPLTVASESAVTPEPWLADETTLN